MHAVFVSTNYCYNIIQLISSFLGQLQSTEILWFIKEWSWWSGSPRKRRNVEWVCFLFRKLNLWNLWVMGASAPLPRANSIPEQLSFSSISSLLPILCWIEERRPAAEVKLVDWTKREELKGLKGNLMNWLSEPLGVKPITNHPVIWRN